MATATDDPQRPAKMPFQNSTVVASKYELDGVEDGSSDASRQKFGSGYTRNDQRDMQRMGKKQELMVSAAFRQVTSSLTWKSECFDLSRLSVSPS